MDKERVLAERVDLALKARKRLEHRINGNRFVIRAGTQAHRDQVRTFVERTSEPTARRKQRMLEVLEDADQV